MTKPTAGGTKHSWLVDDLAAVLSDLRHTADGILRDLDNFQESREEVYLSSLATRTARMFQEIARITAVHSEMRALLDAAKANKSAPDAEDLAQQLTELRELVARVANGAGRHE